MLITLTRTGGFTGIPYAKTIDTTKIDPEKAKGVEEVLVSSHFSKVKPFDSAQGKNSNPDAFTYSISVEREGEIQERTIFENDLDPELRKLISYLQKL